MRITGTSTERTVPLRETPLFQPMSARVAHAWPPCCERDHTDGEWGADTAAVRPPSPRRLKGFKGSRAGGGRLRDLGEVAGCQRVVEGAAGALGGLDVLVNNAGVGGPQKPMEEITAEEWEAGIGFSARCRAQTPPPAPRPQGAGE